MWRDPVTLKMKGWGWLALLLGVLLGTAWARRSQDLHCGACRALVDELEWEIARVDPKKTIQMGSFRINPDGSQSVVEVPYARSEAHLTELLEEVCDRMKEYGEQIDPSTHRKNYVRVVGRNGESSELDLQGIRIDSDISGTLKFACESIVEEYEDELIEFFSREADNVKDKLCSKRTGIYVTMPCTDLMTSYESLEQAACANVMEHPQEGTVVAGVAFYIMFLWK
ncbi:Protein canopy homolog 2 [Apodemus speciosus]|uniref:Protein canopy homolog 2 n=1 Tax=Apodemus speciosus TaxID=105296 RepID=A0ABQ0F8V4_APOSI